MKRRILSLVLCFCMALSLLPMGALAEDNTENIVVTEVKENDVVTAYRITAIYDETPQTHDVSVDELKEAHVNSDAMSNVVSALAKAVYDNNRNVNRMGKVDFRVDVKKTSSDSDSITYSAQPVLVSKSSADLEQGYIVLTNNQLDGSDIPVSLTGVSGAFIKNNMVSVQHKHGNDSIDNLGNLTVENGTVTIDKGVTSFSDFIVGAPCSVTVNNYNSTTGKGQATVGALEESYATGSPVTVTVTPNAGYKVTSAMTR